MPIVGPGFACCRHRVLQGETPEREQAGRKLLDMVLMKDGCKGLGDWVLGELLRSRDQNRQ